MKRYLWFGALLLTLVGILLTGYLTQAHFSGSIGRICQEGQGCDTILRSAWSEFAGLPTALYGFFFYLTAFLLFLVYPLVDPDNRSTYFYGLLGLHLSAFGISVALVGYALISLGTTCMYCNTSLGLITLLTGGLLYWRRTVSDTESHRAPGASLWQTGAVVLLILSLLLGGMLFSQSRSATGVSSDQTQRELSALVRDSRSIGDPSAPIRVVEFFDLACPHCQQFTLNTFPKIRKNYINTGKVIWTFRFFPITRSHPNTLYAHGSLSLVPPNDFLSAKKTIMRQSERWAGRYTDNPRNYFGLFLSQYGLNQGPSDSLLRTIRFRTREFADLGINQTPSFLVNGKLYKGGLPYRRWQSIFDKILQDSGN